GGGVGGEGGPGGGGPREPYFQSGRVDRYRAAAARLLREGHAYHCYCTPERLKAEREAAEARGEAWRYDRTCLRESPERLRALEDAGAPRALRFKVPDGRTSFADAVHGPIEFDGANIEDFVV